MGVKAILTGRLIQTGDELMISVSLEDVRDSRQIWGEQYNRKLSNLVSVQQEIAADIYGRLRPKLEGEGRKLLAKRPRKMSRRTSFTCRDCSIGTNGPKQTSKRRRTISLRQCKKIRDTRCLMRGLRIPTACSAALVIYLHPRLGRRQKRRPCKRWKLMTRWRRRIHRSRW